MSHSIACCGPMDVPICPSEARIKKTHSAPKPPPADPLQDIRSFLRLAIGDDTYTFDQIILK